MGNDVGHCGGGRDGADGFVFLVGVMVAVVVGVVVAFTGVSVLMAMTVVVVRVTVVADAMMGV